MLLASVPWMLDYSVMDYKIDLNLFLKPNLPQRLAWFGTSQLRQHLEETYENVQLLRFPATYDAVAATVFGQADRPPR